VGEKKGARPDLACLVQHGEKAARLVFWEAKHYTNGDLRADLEAGRLPAVCDQVARYKRYISRYREDLLDSYQRVASNLVDFRKMGAKRHLSPLIVDVAKGPATRELLLKEDPEVGLVIFGFDEAQRDHEKWIRHLDNLKTKSSISYTIPKGKAKSLVLKA
jgi:hypothetical protein